MALPLGEERSVPARCYCVGRIKRGGRRDPLGLGRARPGRATQREPGPVPLLPARPRCSRPSPARSHCSQPGPTAPSPAPPPPGPAPLALKPGAFSGSCLLMIPKLRNANLFRADSFSKGNLPQLLIPCAASIQTPRKHLQLFFFFFFLSAFFQGAGGNGEFIENLCFL